ncbi:hypothetical protein A3B51_02905 [Candidatus Curtissbacteria bacterium RIFCSPLOWO2_01_FULL_41_18]|uniref:R3H domain-containing protein n=1 Tax=Candidatus Curtissbacteria bacterium RIFCSPLOWO2_01_FULL_41_18 TaxID=1797727 RepID=A0A1F5HJZ0_9BACT|nr:MAG: hypothetical protein A3B51_02905 [Candidatus Curtissbacteria bacterium RIFCSPLOWO2_01_FULL_41_18]
MANKKLDENLVAQNVKELIEKLGVSATAEISRQNRTFFIDIASNDSPVLIGKHGSNLESLQFVLAVRIKQQTAEEDFEIFLDIDGWRKLREEKLTKLATSIAQRVAESSKGEPIYNLKAYERRLIHTILADHPKVTTVSEGEGEGRYLIIKPK